MLEGGCLSYHQPDSLHYWLPLVAIEGHYIPTMVQGTVCGVGSPMSEGFWIELSFKQNPAGGSVKQQVNG